MHLLRVLREQYLSDFKQQPGHATAELNMHIKELVKKRFQSKDNEAKQYKKDLFFDAQNVKAYELINEVIMKTSKSQIRSGQDWGYWKGTPK